MTSAGDDIARLKRQLADERAARAAAEARASEAVVRATSAEALVAHLRLAIEKLRRSLYGSRSEHGHKLLDQMELQLEDLVATAAEEAARIELAGKGATVPPHTRRQPVRQPLPEHLPRERVVVPGPSACPCCGSSKLAKLGEDITETLEVIPRQWKVIQHVREKFSCRACETICQAPAPFHVISRGRAGANLLAMVLYGKFGLHQPLNRQSAEYAREGVELPLSTLADHVGACAATLQPLVDLIRAHVFAGERIHGDETPVPMLAKTKCQQARLWTYVRNDRPFGGRDPRAIARARIPSGIWPAMAGSCKPTATVAMADSPARIDGRGRSQRRRAGRMPGASSSCSPTSPRRHGTARSPS
jgi:transposase